MAGDFLAGDTPIQMISSKHVSTGFISAAASNGYGSVIDTNKGSNVGGVKDNYRSQKPRDEFAEKERPQRINFHSCLPLSLHLEFSPDFLREGGVV